MPCRSSGESHHHGLCLLLPLQASALLVRPGDLLQPKPGAVHGYWKLVPRAQTQSGGPCNVGWHQSQLRFLSGLDIIASSEVLPCCLHTQLQGPTFEALIWNPPPHPQLRCAPPQSSGQLPTRRTGLHGANCFLPESFMLLSRRFFTFFFYLTSFFFPVHKMKSILLRSRMGKEETKHVGSGQDVPPANLSCRQDPAQTPQASKTSHPYCHQRVDRAQS